MIRALSMFVSDLFWISPTGTHSIHWKFLTGLQNFFGEKVRATKIFYDSGFFSHRKKIYQRTRLLCKQFLNTPRALLAIHPKNIREKEKSTPEMFGPRLTLDLSECNPEKISDLSYIYDLLDEL